jgi:cystathionine beta-synthase
MPPRNSRPYDNIVDAIGWTPLIKLNAVTDGVPGTFYVKAEFMNPGASVKDRIGLAIIEDAERRGALKPGGVIVEATSGNTGMSLAMAAASRGYRCVFVMPDKMSQEKVKLLRAFGAEVVIVPTAVPPDHPDHYNQKAKSIAEATSGGYLANQFYNQANPDAHFATTGPEIWEQTEGRVTHFLAGAGTGGTITGVGRYLKQQNANVRIVGVDPVGSVLKHFHETGEMLDGAPYKVEGLGSDKIGDALDMSVTDLWVEVSDAEAFAMTLRLCREEGLFVGGSSGLHVHAAIELAKEVDDPDAVYVTVLCDWGEHYLTKIYDEDWMRENGFMQRTTRAVHDLIAAKAADAPELVSVNPTTPMRVALSAMTSYDVGQLPVVSDGECVGSLSESELMGAVIEDPGLLDRPVEALMEAPYPVIEGHKAADEVTKLLSRSNAAVLVREGGALKGIVTRYDVVQGLTGLGK